MTTKETGMSLKQASGQTPQHLVLVSGPSGAGRSTALHMLEDLGFEIIDNLPLSLMDKLLDDASVEGPVALGLDVRNRDFGVDRLIASIDLLRQRPGLEVQLMYLDADADTLLRRYSETRRRHPLAPNGAPEIGIAREREMLVPLRDRADVLIDTTDLTPHELRTVITRQFPSRGGETLGVTIQSFSYKRGLPLGADLVFDCRFLRNPHWEPALRGKDGRAPDVADYVTDDPRYTAFFAKMCDLVFFMLPECRAEGKTHLTIAIGCTGGQHRSVTLTENLAKALADKGWRVSKRHRELERRSAADG